MRRYEYKIVEVKASAWSIQSVRSQDALVDLLNREGRAGWCIVPMTQQTFLKWRSVLLQREVD